MRGGAGSDPAFPGCRLVRRAIPLVSKVPPAAGLRASTTGLAYLSHQTSGVYLAGWIFEQHLVRPVLRVPDAGCKAGTVEGIHAVKPA